MPWDSSIPTFMLDDVPDAADLNKFINNLNYLKDRTVRTFIRSDGLSNFTTTSITFTPLGSPFTYTATMKNGIVLAMFRAPSIGGVTVDFTFALDGTILGSTGTGIHRKRTGVFENVLLFRPIPVTAGSRTIDVYWKTSSGTATLLGVGRYIEMYVREISWTP